MTTPTDPDLALAQRARELADAASPGPWLADTYQPLDAVVYSGSEEWLANIGHFADIPVVESVSDLSPNARQIAEGQIANCEFIAAARSLIPDLADAVERLVQERDKARETLAMVEYDPEMGTCMWCGAMYNSHRDDCQRQRSLGLAP